MKGWLEKCKRKIERAQVIEQEQEHEQETPQTLNIEIEVSKPP